jgi:hypothetical protein
VAKENRSGAEQLVRGKIHRQRKNTATQRADWGWIRI